MNLKSNLEYYLDLIRDYFKKNDKLSIWDLYIIYTPLNIDLWCNIEKEIHNSININFGIMFYYQSIIILKTLNGKKMNILFSVQFLLTDIME